MTRGTRVLGALMLAALAALFFHTHVFVAFRPIRAKVVQTPMSAMAGVVRVTTAGFPQLKDLRPPFALIARIKAPTGAPSEVAIAVDGVPVCERNVTGGRARRIDCAVAVPWSPATDHEVTLQGPQTPWALEYLELATHHGNSTGAHTLFVLPGTSTGYVRPGIGWSIAVWWVLAGFLLVPSSRLTIRWARVAYRAVAGLVVVLLAVIQCSQWASDYRVVLAAGTFTIWLAVLLAPRLWTAGRWLTERADRASRDLRASGGARVAPWFEAHPAWRPTRALASKAGPWIALALVVGLFCAPLFVNLGEPEARSDEAIYFYAVDRILDTGDWLTPRSIPDDVAFLEKPPLKFWLVAGGMRTGLLPRDERGQRWFDALFGAIGFVYVYYLGCRLAGPICGVTAVLVLFTLDPLLFEHGLRSNNMEAALFLCYCGGLFHFARWVDAGSDRARGHAVAVAAYFVLGFMTKFVAALFLPVVCVAALAVGGGAWARLRSGWRDWVVPALMTAALVLPWFVYEHVKYGDVLWRTMLASQVYQRVTVSLDASHIQPWYFYLTQTWKELGNAGSQMAVALGVAWLVVAAARGRSGLSRLILIWGVLPIAAISLSTSKLLHYAYPFWPMLGLAAGYLVADVVGAIDGPRGVAAAASLRRLVPRRAASWCADDPWHRSVLLGVAALAGATAAGTALSGPFAATIGGARFGSGSVLWPLLVASAALFIGGYLTTLMRLALVVVVLMVIPAQAYSESIAHATRIDHPIRAVRDCMVSVQRTGVKTGSGVLGVYGDIQHYSYYYYVWRLGAWKVNREFVVEETERHLWTSGEQTPVIVSRKDYETLVRRAGLWEATFPGGPGPMTAPSDPVADAARNPLRSGARFNDDVAVLLPGPFQSCLPDILAAAGQPLWKTPAPDRRR